MSDITAVLQSGLDLHRAGRLVEAEATYRRVLEMHPRHALSSHLLGLIAFQYDKLDLAAKYIEQAIRWDAYHAPFRADLGEIYRALRRIPEAIETYRKAIELNPEMPDAHTHLGTLLESSGQDDEALESYRRALAIDPNYAEAHAHLGLALERRGQLEPAQAALEKAVQLAPESAEWYLALGRCLHARGKLLEAIACYQKAQQLEAGHPAAQQLLNQARAELPGRR